MRFITVKQFEERELRNGEEFVLVCDIGNPLTVAERNQILYQVSDAQNRFKVIDEWTDSAYRYYLKIKIENNIVWGIAILLVLGTVFVGVVGYYLSDLVTAVGIVTQKAFPLAVVGVIGLGIVIVYRWAIKAKR